MTDLKIDPVTHDLVLTNGRLELVYDSEYRRQRADIALKHSQGEWFRDRAAGTDYLGAILGKSSDLTRRAEFRRRLLQIPGIVEIVRIELELDPSTRKLSGEIECIEASGELLEIRFAGRT